MAAIQQLLLMVMGAGNKTYATWNPSDKSASITLSNGNLTASASAGGHIVARCNQSKSSGKWYWEITVGAPANSISGLGVCSAAQGLDVYPYSSTRTAWDYQQAGNVGYNDAYNPTYTAYTTGDVLGFALDASAGTTAVYKNGTLQGTISHTIVGAPPYYPAVYFYGASAVTANFGATAFTYSPPSGYNAGFYE